MKNSNIDNIFIYWLYFVSLILISVYILESYKFISGLFKEDISYISSLIISIFVFYLLRGGYYLFKLRHAVDGLDSNNTHVKNNIFKDILEEYKASSSNK